MNVLQFFVCIAANRIRNVFFLFVIVIPIHLKKKSKNKTKKISFPLPIMQIKNQSTNTFNDKRNSHDIGTTRMNAIERALEKIQIEFQKIKHS